MVEQLTAFDELLPASLVGGLELPHVEVLARFGRLKDSRRFALFFHPLTDCRRQLLDGVTVALDYVIVRLEPRVQLLDETRFAMSLATAAGFSRSLRRYVSTIAVYGSQNECSAGISNLRTLST